MSDTRFDVEGLVRLPGVIGGADVAAMRAAVERMLERIDLVEIVGALRPGPGSSEELWEVGRGEAFAPLPGLLASAVDGVFGPGMWAPIDGQHGGLAAPNVPLPGAGAWTVPHAAWHVDEPTSAAHDRGWGLLAFAFLDDVEPGSGATVAIAGSHRRLQTLAATIAPTGLLTTEDAVAALRRDEPWFAELFAPGGDPAARRRRFLDEVYVSDGIPLRVVELTGAAGDVVLMDPRCLHTVSANAGRRARLQMRMTCGRRA
jgi:hypothetical protein